ncbi:DNA repair protein RAD51 homolog 3-like [Sipha flava]|uniref:DNA repair protein RAD51 homolog 3 n=1 Tax=Sipha flava TaxID=143950 RepID=A0A8B8FIZ8_9HEMI|nr:DNA repair protein RAD51 homolog 3-like [Sipha flava]
MNRPIWTLPLSKPMINKLNKLGYKCCEDLIDSLDDSQQKSKYLRKHLESESDIRDMLKVPKPMCAAELLEEECDCIATFCKAIDELLNGGVQLGRITELSGAPGSGKSQLCMQLCVSVQIPICFEGLQSEAIYVDTNSNFSQLRLTEMIDGFLDHVSKVLSGPNDFKGANSELLKSLTAASMLSKIHRVQMNDLNQLHTLYTILEQHPNVKLIVVDSFVMPLYTIENSTRKNMLVHSALDLLQSIASEHNLAVVLTNDLTTVVHEKGTEISSALGETFAHRVQYRLLLSKIPNSSNGYTALLKKSVEHSRSAAQFAISSEGVRDMRTEQQ